MRVLIDECAPRRLRRELPGHDVHTVSEMGWSGKKNGDLLQSMAAESFEVLVTVDQNIRYQQNLHAAGVGVLVLVAATNRLADLLPLMPAALKALGSIKAGDVIEILNDRERIRRFEIETGTEFLVPDDDARRNLACRVIDSREALADHSVKLLSEFIRGSGDFDLSGIEIFAETTSERGDFSLRFTSHDYDDTYFEVYFGCNDPPQPPFWHVILTISFW